MSWTADRGLKVTNGGPVATAVVHRYPDPHDQIPALTMEMLPHAISDQALLTNVVERLPVRPRRVVDVGAGDGRLLEDLAGFADEVTVVEPDSRRLGRAKNRARGLPGAKVAFIEQDAATFAAGGATQFDLVVCTHVVQHVSHHERSRLFAALSALVTSEGHILLSFPAVDARRPRHLLSRFSPDRAAVTTAAVTPERFNQAATMLAQADAKPSSSMPLPVWQPPVNYVERGLRHAGLGIRWVLGYRPFRFRIDAGLNVSPSWASATDTAVLAARHRDPDDC